MAVAPRNDPGGHAISSLALPGGDGGEGLADPPSPLLGLENDNVAGAVLSGGQQHQAVRPSIVAPEGQDIVLPVLGAVAVLGRHGRALHRPPERGEEGLLVGDVPDD
eukprot:250025-Alexandrium_andersonii.AAC.1